MRKILLLSIVFAIAVPVTVWSDGYRESKGKIVSLHYMLDEGPQRVVVSVGTGGGGSLYLDSDVGRATMAAIQEAWVQGKQVQIFSVDKDAAGHGFNPIKKVIIYP